MAAYQRRWGGLLLPPASQYDGGPKYFDPDSPESDTAGWWFEAGMQRTAVPYSFMISPSGEFGIQAERWAPLHATVEGWVESLALAHHASIWAKQVTKLVSDEVKARWQSQIRAKAKQTAATTGGIVIDTRARIGYTAPIGTTDEDRLRHLTVALPPRYAARLFDAQEQGASDQQLQQIAAESLKEVYFQDTGRRAGQLEEVRFTDIAHLEFDL